MVFNTTVNTISVISCRSVLLVEETGGPGENHRPVVCYLATTYKYFQTPAMSPSMTIYLTTSIATKLDKGFNYIEISDCR